MNYLYIESIFKSKLNLEKQKPKEKMSIQNVRFHKTPEYIFAQFNVSKVP